MNKILNFTFKKRELSLHFLFLSGTKHNIVFILKLIQILNIFKTIILYENTATVSIPEYNRQNAFFFPLN